MKRSVAVPLYIRADTPPHPPDSVRIVDVEDGYEVDGNSQESARVMVLTG